MSPSLADALYQHLLDRFPPDRAYPRGALYTEGMPPLVASLLGRTLDRWLEHELDSLQSAWFDFDAPGVRAARAELVVALGRTARVPQAAWAETLRYAVGLVVRHLVTPARALTDATFEGQPDPLPTPTVRARLHTFEAYGYLPEIADAYLGQKQPAEVDPDTLFDILTRIDHRVTGDYEAADWLRLLGPLFKLSRHVPGWKGIPAEELARFFAAKGHEEAADRLDDKGEARLDEAALRALLADVAPPPHAHEPSPRPPAPPAPEPARTPTPAPPQPEAPGAPREAAPVIPRAASPEPVSPEPVSPEPPAAAPPPGPALVPVAPPEEEEPASQEERPAPGEEPAAEQPSVPEPDEDQPLWKRFAGGPTVETSVPAQALPPTPPPPAAPSEPGEGEDGERPLWQRFLANLRGASTPAGDEAPPVGAEAAPPEDLSLDALETRVLGRPVSRRRRRFVRDLFRGDEDAYRATLRRLVPVTTWTEASKIIAEDVFRRHGVDIYSETAVAFTDAVQAHLTRSAS